MDIRTRDVIRITVVVLGLILALLFIWFAHHLVFIAFLGLLFAVAISAGASYLEKIKIPRSIGAPLIMLSAIGVLVLFGMWSGPTVKAQYAELRDQMPIAIAKIDHKLDTLGLSLSKESMMSRLEGAQKYILPFLTSTVAVASGLLLIIFIAIYSAIHSSLYRRGFLALLPENARRRGDEIISKIIKSLRKWLVTQLIAMVIIGLVTTVTLMVLGVKAAVPLGILAGLLEFVPTIGPILSAVPAIAMGFSDSPEKAAMVAVAYIGIQFLENHLLIPVLMKEGVDIPPVLTIVTQAAMAMLLGFTGLLVAVPMLVVVMILVQELYVKKDADNPI